MARTDDLLMLTISNVVRGSFELSFLAHRGAIGSVKACRRTIATNRRDTTEEIDVYRTYDR